MQGKDRSTFQETRVCRLHPILRPRKSVHLYRIRRYKAVLDRDMNIFAHGNTDNRDRGRP